MVVGYHDSINNIQVAQLWQGDHAKLDIFSYNIPRYSQNHAQNWNFGPPYGGIRGNICALCEILAQRNFVADFH